MSLLNDMLRDLDARRADSAAGVDLRREIRILPATRSSPRPLLWLGVVAGVGIAVAVVWGLSFSEREAPAVSAVASVPPAPVATPEPAPVTVPSAPNDTPTKQTEVPTTKTALQLDLLLREPPAEVVPRRAEAASIQPNQTALLKNAAKNDTPPTAIAVPKSDPASGKSGKEMKPTLAEAKAGAGVVEKRLVLATPRDRAEAEWQSAQTHLAQNRVVEAAEALRAALRHDPGHTPSRQLLLKILLEGRRHDEAIVVLQDGLEIQPAQTGWAMTLARLWVDRNDLAAAERVLARSWPHAGGNAAYAGAYAHVRSRLGHLREAIDLYHAAIQNAPTEGRWWFGLASTLESAGRGGEARDAYRQARNCGNLPAELAAIAEQRLER